MRFERWFVSFFPEPVFDIIVISRAFARIGSSRQGSSKVGYRKWRICRSGPVSEYNAAPDRFG